jgi:hypothetical protein
LLPFQNSPVSTDPTVIRSFAISVDDIVTAYEAARDGKPVVLRVTPPFSGRMRARIHHFREINNQETIHIDPDTLIEDDSPAYPTPEETEDRLRASEREYSIETHHTFHVEAVQEWRDAVRSHVVSEITLETPDGPHTVEVKPLG